MKKIISFFIWCSGTSKNILEQCPSEKSKYAGIGGTVLFTGIFAFIASSYALYKVFYLDNQGNIIDNAKYFSIGFGLLWGVMIFNLDRYIVSSLTKEVGFWQALKVAAPRIFLATLISIVIAKPLEVKLFENRIKRQIYENSEAKLNGDLKYYNDELKIKSSEISILERQLLETISRRSEDPQNVKDQIVNYASCNKEYIDISNRNQPRINQYSAEINSDQNEINILRNKNETLNIQKGKLNSEIDAAEIQQIENYIRVNNNSIANYRNEISTKNQLISQLKIPLDNKAKECNNIKKEIDDERKSYLNVLDALQGNIEQQKDVKFNIIAQVDTSLNIQKNKSKAINKESFNETFITQIEALGDLTTNSMTMLLVNYFIILLFFAVETAPVFTKLFSSRGPYDDIIKDEGNKEKEITKIRIENEIYIATEYYKKVKDQTIALIESFFVKVIPVRNEKMNLIIEDWKNNNLSFSEISSRIKQTLIEEDIYYHKKTIINEVVNPKPNGENKPWFEVMRDIVIHIIGAAFFLLLSKIAVGQIMKPPPGMQWIPLIWTFIIILILLLLYFYIIKKKLLNKDKNNNYNEAR